MESDGWTEPATLSAVPVTESLAWSKPDFWLSGVTVSDTLEERSLRLKNGQYTEDHSKYLQFAYPRSDMIDDLFEGSERFVGCKEFFEVV